MEDRREKSQSTNDPRSTRARSHAASFAVSVAAHAAAIAALIYFAPGLQKPHSDWVLAYLVEVGDGLSGPSTHAGAGAAPSIALRSEAGPLLIPTRPSPHKSARAPARATPAGRDHETESPDAKPASLAPASSAPAVATGRRGGESNSRSSDSDSSSNAGDGSGSGQASFDGSGDGAGSSLAHADYGNNPPPLYPAIARRRDQQGTVTIRVLVGPDGSVERAEIAESSRFDALDDSALDTVRRRWRFVPARRAGIPVESWVLVPIRFALTEANARR